LDPNFTDQQIADNFLITQPTTIQGVSWFGRYEQTSVPTNPVSFSIRFFANAGSVPAASPLATFNVLVDATDTGATFTGILGNGLSGTVPWFSYAAAVNLALDIGTYWVSILEADPRTPGFHPNQWLWDESTTHNISPRAFRNGDVTAWAQFVTPPLDQAFSLSGVVTATSIPEPSTLLLVALFNSAIFGFLHAAPRRKVLIFAPYPKIRFPPNSAGSQARAESVFRGILTSSHRQARVSAVGSVKGPSPRRSGNCRDAPKTERAAVADHAGG
jgi:hypothetical protein